MKRKSKVRYNETISESQIDERSALITGIDERSALITGIDERSALLTGIDENADDDSSDD